MPFRIEAARDIAACARTVPIQEEVWSGDVAVPPQLLLAMVHGGGFVANGYAEADAEPAGFVFGFASVRDGRLSHHSHMLAVRPALRHSGLAVALKSAQREHCLAQGVTVMTWTMDPLEARNARFNLSSLAAYTREYHRDFYGPMPDKLNAGLPSDRFTVEWPIATDRVARRLRHDDPSPALEEVERGPVRYLLRSKRDRPSDLVAPDGEGRLLLEIPSDIQAIKRQDPALALAWRHTLRTALETAFAAGYAAVGFLRGADGRGAYLLEPLPGEAIG
ncbi:MAG: hypothetical protein NVS9B6_17580 [Candidatus Limnocylindrales bacterium]